jgi:hypothetical protein
MSAAARFKPHAPDVRAVVRLEEALPPGTHPFIDRDNRLPTTVLRVTLSRHAAIG